MGADELYSCCTSEYCMTEILWLYDSPFLFILLKYSVSLILSMAPGVDNMPSVDNMILS